MKKSAGFTIIELLIATAVFSVILVGITTAIIRFSHQYYKGVVASTTQETARTIIDDVSRSIQFNGGAVTPIDDAGGGNKGYCLGANKRYSFMPLQQVKDTAPVAAQHQGRHGLVSDAVTACGSTTDPLNVRTMVNFPAGTVSGRELLGEHMRIAKFNIVPDATGSTFAITVKVVYGDDDLLTSATDPDAMLCRSAAGSHFCATSELTTTINKRVN